MKSNVVDEITRAVNRFRGAIAEIDPAIASARDYSKLCLSRIKDEIFRNPPDPELGICLMAVAGSLARLEASESSDLDLMIVTTAEVDLTEVTQKICEWRNKLCDRLSLERPNGKGVFARPVCIDDLSRVSGEAGEPYDTTAKRTLFLLESQCVFGFSEFHGLIETILGNFVEDVVNDPKKNFVFLINDVVRYFRALCVNYQYTKSEIEYGKWPIRNIKLRHSRVLMYFSLILSVGYLSKINTSEKIAGLKSLVALTPLERIFAIYALSGEEQAYAKIAYHYGIFMSALSNPETRRELENLEYERRYESKHFASVKDNSDQFAAELSRFYRAREGDWDDRFFEYMIL